ncbi:PrpF domain-containing protein [Brevibacillus sp. TJ4]|uniref:PrpF domain-containing protein n=1 Tax=Brevibacillus sp. TJ4 TaxID=3234853 RepID=UPI0037D80401
MSQFSIPCAVYRGGTSRGLFFHKRHLPKERELQAHVFLAGIDAYNVSQIDGLGAGTSHASKVCVISEPSVEGADIDYTFYQVGIGEPIIDDKGTCGNLMAAVGAFAVDEGYVRVAPDAQEAVVAVNNTNIQKTISITVPLTDGKAKVSGDYRMPGVKLPGAKYVVDILSPGGGKTGKTLPVGSAFTLATNNRQYRVSFVDVVNPFVFVSAAELGITGSEPNSELSANEALVQELEMIRLQMAVAAGMCGTVEEARQTPSIPKIAIVAAPHDYVTSGGERVSGTEVDLVAKMVSMGKFHRTFAGSGLYCLAAAALLPGTIPHQHLSGDRMTVEKTVRIGHPEGIAEVRASLTDDGQDVRSVGMERTARRIIKGDLYVPAYRERCVGEDETDAYRA